MPAYVFYFESKILPLCDEDERYTCATESKMHNHGNSYASSRNILGIPSALHLGTGEKEDLTLPSEEDQQFSPAYLFFRGTVTFHVTVELCHR